MKPRSASSRSRDAEASRQAILRAAAREFAAEGVAGARMQQIAREAGVNKALLHYYFRDKETLHGAVLDSVFAGLSRRVQEALAQPLPPRQKILAFAGAHFDYIAASPISPRLVQQEMTRAGRRGSPHLKRIVRKYLRPVQKQVLEALHEGIQSGEFRRVHPQHFLFSMVALNVFYFSSRIFIGMLAGGNPFAPERIAERRAAVMDQISAALFVPAKSPRAERGKQ
jgi:TetR/AcrR family transcriptional regulator